MPPRQEAALPRVTIAEQSVALRFSPRKWGGRFFSFGFCRSLGCIGSAQHEMIVRPPSNECLGGLKLLQGVNDAVKRIALPLRLAKCLLGGSYGFFKGVAAGGRTFGGTGRTAKCYRKKETNRKGEWKRF
jgi:hypothetical protein